MAQHHHHGADMQYGTSPKTLKAYLTGLVLCVILTLAAFAIVAKQTLSVNTMYIALAILAIVQFIVQVVFFLRLNASPEGKWNLMPFLFALLVIVILVGGSLWIMYNLNYNMT